MSKLILGINAYHGDVSAVLLDNGKLLAAVEEERFRRIKHWAGFPEESIRSCIKMAGIKPDQIDAFAVSRNPRANLMRKTLYTLQNRPSLKLLSSRARNTARVSQITRRIAQTLGMDPGQVQKRTHWVEHHPAHLASTFFVSPFEEAAVCAVDGFGDFVSTSLAMGKNSKLHILEQVFFPHSLGIFYLSLTQYLGFQKYGDEYKVMGLAAYGQPNCLDQIRQLIELQPEGTFRLDLNYFRHHTNNVSLNWDDGEPTLGPAYSPELEKLLGPARKPEEPLQPRHEAIAASLQQVFEESLFHLLNALYQKTRSVRLCLAGGCAMNSLANGKIQKQTPFREVYIQPAAADNGTALGAAYYVHHQIMANRNHFTMDHALWGPQFSEAELNEKIEEYLPKLKEQNCQITNIDDTVELCHQTANEISNGKIVGWFQGRMEWGARALGNRSILADPRREDMREIINTKIKFREKFRPFASSILEEAVDDYFVAADLDPFMVKVYPVRSNKRSVIPAVTHFDGSGRLQVVQAKQHPLYWQLLKAFEARTGVPVLLNTSFNENEPIVHRPEEALDCFLRTKMDLLVLGTTMIEKSSGKET